jgi:patatin-related protein
MPDTKLVHVALVMNGGVSLAVWMGGVTHEIDRLTRRGLESETDSPWQAICRAAEKTVAIDYVSGTSAGGLNGSLLATAIARGCPLPNLRELWGEEGRLVRGKLLHPSAQAQQTSVLDGQFFEAVVAERLEALKSGQQPQDVTLLVTASALYGSSTAVTDANRQTFKAGDHRRVYRFRRRAKAKTLGSDGRFQSQALDEFAEHPDELALAARASAGFPFAFGPTQETSSLHELNVTSSVGGPSWLVDGGVLDNAPFRPLLDEMRDQPFQDPGTRWIVYVVPSKQEGPKRFKAGRGAPPPPWTDLPARLWSLSRESDLRDDVIALADEWEDARASVHPPEVLIGGEDAGAPDINLDAVAGGLWDAYRRTKMASLETEFLQLAQTPLMTTDRHPERLEEFLTLDLCWIPNDRHMAARTMETLDNQWQWGPYTARRMARWSPATREA